ncbi:30S ribosome-binding factor RbfA [Vicingaceae bacterium]|jgi:ribosome-binding factor A|nr:30S ribosome-binding factor RbfA [Vicingaceae bacterium]
MSSIRQEKVARLLLKEISQIFHLNSANWFPGTMVTVTVVRPSPDFSFAKVYLSVFGKMEPKECVDLISAHSKMVRGELGKRIGKQLRITPEVAFYVDDSLDYAEEITKLLNE